MMKKLLITFIILLSFCYIKAQTFPNVDSVKKYITDSITSGRNIKAPTLQKAYSGLAKFLPDVVQDTADVTVKAHGMQRFQRKDSTAYVYDTIGSKRWRKLVSIDQKLNIADTAGIKARLYAGANITISGTYPNLTIESTGGSASPAGNYGAIQLQRNSTLSATDSLIYAAGELRINTSDNGAYALQVAGNGYFKGSGANIVLEPNAGTNAYLQMKDQAGGLSYLSSDLGLSYIVSTGSYAHNFYNNGILTLQIKNISGTSIGGGIETSTSQIASAYTGTAGADKGAFHLERIIDAGSTGPNHHGYVAKTTFRTGAASFNEYYSTSTIGNDNPAYTQGHLADFQSGITKDGRNLVGDLYHYALLSAYIKGGTAGALYGIRYWDATREDTANLGSQVAVYIPKLKAANTGLNVAFRSDSSQIIALDGNILIGDSLVATNARKTIHLFNGTAPSSNISGAILYAESGELKVRDGSGNITILSDLSVGAGIDTIYRIAGKDSIFWRKSGIVYAIKDSVGSGSGSVGGSDTYVLFNDAGSANGDAGMTFNKTTNALKVAGSAGDITSWFNANSGNSASTTSTNPGVFWFSGGAGSMYGATLGYHSGYGTEIFTGNSTSFFFSRGGGGNTSNATVAMTLNASDELIIANGITDGGDYKLQVNGNGLISGTITTAAPTDGTARPWKIGDYVTTAPSATGYVQVEINGTKYKLLAATY